jgi:poly-gamma-glutamate synthesis protein (capsule biosynthesis protein)
VFPHGAEAQARSPGLAPIHAYNLYQDAVPYLWQPGALPTVRTVDDERDVAALYDSIEAARALADVVVVSGHWGDWSRPAVLTDHEARIARLAIDAGADVVVGHHHHLLRGIEWYRDCPIFYGLGHFVFDMHRIVTATRGETDGEPPSNVPFDYYGPDSRLTAIAWAQLDGGSWRAGVLPCQINRQGQAVPYAADAPEGREVVSYLHWACAEAKLGSELRPCDVTVGGLTAAEVVQA